MTANISQVTDKNILPSPETLSVLYIWTLPGALKNRSILLCVHSECPHLSPLQGPRKSVGFCRRMGWHLSFSELGEGFSLEMVLALRRRHLAQLMARDRCGSQANSFTRRSIQGMGSLLWWLFSSESRMLLPLGGHWDSEAKGQRGFPGNLLGHRKKIITVNHSALWDPLRL